MLAQNPDDTIDKPIYYANQVIVGASKNYSTTEKETLIVIYVIKKFHHYMLGNNFTFLIDHQALIYLVNKPTITRQITRCLLLLQEFNFKVIYKLGKVHFVLDQLSRAKNGELAIGVED
jgi:hypothetical protein